MLRIKCARGNLDCISGWAKKHVRNFFVVFASWNYSTGEIRSPVKNLPARICKLSLYDLSIRFIYMIYMCFPKTWSIWDTFLAKNKTPKSKRFLRFAWKDTSSAPARDLQRQQKTFLCQSLAICGASGIAGHVLSSSLSWLNPLPCSGYRSTWPSTLSEPTRRLRARMQRR